jgi:hypothetical protein
MENTDGQAEAIVTALRASGMVLQLDAQGNLALAGTPKALAVWHAMAEAIEGLGDIAALSTRVDTLSVEHHAEDQPKPTSNPPTSADPLSRWQSIGPGLKEMMGREGPPPAPSVPQVTIPQPAPGRVKLPPCPRWEGMQVVSPGGQGWVARPNAARF